MFTTGIVVNVNNSFGHITLKLLSFAVAATCNIQSTDSFQHDNSCIIVAYVLSLIVIKDVAVEQLNTVNFAGIVVSHIFSDFHFTDDF